MVGVAGKSKGCATCRRRKIKCDETKPTCQRCKRSELHCEGYERYPVFIRTGTGYKKRVPLEEVKPTSTNVLSLPNPAADAVGLVSWFWTSFARFCPSKYALQSHSHWLDHFMDWPQAQPPLQQALLAVSITRLGKANDRPDVVEDGRTIYTRSLSLMQNALLDPKVVMHDDTLAATCILVMYELFDSTQGNLDGWLDHLSGVYRLIQHRGPTMHMSAGGRAIFEHSRYLIMLQHLVLRKGCALSDEEWLSTPWQDQSKSTEQLVFDHGLRLAGVFERRDLAVEGHSTDVDLSELFSDCCAIYDRIDQLQTNFILPAVLIDLQEVAGTGRDPFVVRNPAALVLNITALSIRLGACSSACDVYDRMEKTHSSAEDVKWIFEKSQHFLSDRLPLAQQILNAVKVCVYERVGAMGAARMIFALRLAMEQYRPSDPAAEECQALLLHLNGLGHRFEGIIKTKNSTPLGFEPSLVQANGAVLARIWQRYADANTAKSRILPDGTGNLPYEALATWAG